MSRFSLLSAKYLNSQSIATRRGINIGKQDLLDIEAVREEHQHILAWLFSITQLLLLTIRLPLLAQV
jgi:hypothetical protein